MLPEHFALTAGRFLTILTKIVQIYAMLVTFLHLLTKLYQVVYYLCQFIEKSSAICKLSLYSFATVRTFWFQFQTLGDAAFTIKFRTMRAHCRVNNFTITYLAVKQFLKSIFLFVNLRKVSLYNLPLFHKKTLIRCKQSIFKSFSILAKVINNYFNTKNEPLSTYFFKLC